MGLVAALEWLEKTYRLCRVDMLGEVRVGLCRINPRHETPVFITDEGRILTETMAIAYQVRVKAPGKRRIAEQR